MCFELLTGWPPFYDRDFSKMCEKILYKPLNFPSSKYNFTSDVEDLIRGLLIRDPDKRLFFQVDPADLTASTAASDRDSFGARLGPLPPFYSLEQ